MNSPRARPVEPPAAGQRLLVDPIHREEKRRLWKVRWLSQPGSQSWELPPGMLTLEPGGTTEGFRPPASVLGTCPLHIIRHQKP